MPTVVNTSIDLGSIALSGEVPHDDLLTFAAAHDCVPGTILARDSVSLKLVPYVKGGSTNQNGIPKAILAYDVTALAAGDIPVRVYISGQMNQRRLIIDADGSGVNVDNSVLDQLRAYGLVPVNVQLLSS